MCKAVDILSYMCLGLPLCIYDIFTVNAKKENHSLTVGDTFRWLIKKTEEEKWRGNDEKMTR